MCKWTPTGAAAVDLFTLTFVPVERVVRDLTVRALVESQTSIQVAVGGVVFDRGVVAATVQHKPILAIVMDNVVLDAHVVTPLRRN